MFGSRPIATNSVVPMAKPPSARARMASVRRAGVSWDMEPVLVPEHGGTGTVGASTVLASTGRTVAGSV
ncbi:hypothetical protein GCM10009627_07460 [Curtobacterium herbarum]|uniref:Uncharacterized protein n=1 Tax=Curtobacterium herbarum TaxID=150122 RepID=A0ABN1Z9Z8_9MICO